MRKLSDTLTRLAAFGEARGASGRTDGNDRLDDLAAFGANPGGLRARTYLPADLAPGAALVVVLHGCTQTAAGYDHGSGWSQLADAHGFALLFPEQQRANNANLCFNWFQAGDNRRDAGELLSIRQMIAALLAAHPIDPARIFITGLSAGGAMSSAMLAAYPELFAGGAIIAGLPHGVAATVPEAFDRMRGHGLPDAAALGALVTRASPHRGPWPSISVWHGEGDATVAITNADAIVAQWRAVQDIAATPSTTDRVDGVPHRVWRDAAGRAAIEEYRIPGLGHGTPLATGGADGCGVAGPYMLEAGISSTRHIARVWGLIKGEAAPMRKAAPASADRAPVLRSTRPTPMQQPGAERATAGPAAVIEKALRAAGLMR